MLIVAGTIEIDPADADVLRAAAAPMMAATLAEPGCQQYVFSISVVDPSQVQVFEIWDSAEDLAAHFETAHMAEWRQALADGVTIRGRNLHRYEIAGVEPL
jgi:quinol monooxygenase YgiN